MSIVLHSVMNPEAANPFLLVPGIRERPESMFDWTDRAARHLRLEHGIDAEKLEYYLWALRNPAKLRRLSDELAEVIRCYNSKGIVPNIMAHSNGNVVGCRTFRKYPDVRVGTFFMVMPACWSSFHSNGLNDALKGNEPTVRNVVCFHSKNDSAVRWGGLTSFLRFAGMGYGRLSYTGPLEVAPIIARRVRAVDMTPWGHSTFGLPAALPGFLDHCVIPYATYSDLRPLRLSSY